MGGRHIYRVHVRLREMVITRVDSCMDETRLELRMEMLTVRFYQITFPNSQNLVLKEFSWLLHIKSKNHKILKTNQLGM